MSPGGASSSTSEDVVALDGWLYPADGTTVGPDEVRAYLRAAGLLGAVAVRPRDALAEAVAAITGTGDAVELSLATDGRHVSALRDGALAVGPTLDDVVAGLAERFGCVVEVHHAFADGTPSTDVPDVGEVGEDAVGEEGPVVVDHPDEPRRSVLLCRLAPEYLPLLARVSGSPIRVLEVGGWVVVSLDADANPWLYPWLHGDLPVWALDLMEGARAIAATLDPAAQVPLFLTPTGAWSTTFAVHEVEGDAVPVVRRLEDPTRNPGSVVEQVLAHPALAHVDAERLRAALASPDDGGWFSRVLEALGLPLVAAEVVEGRADLSGTTTVEPAGLGSVLGQGMDLYVDDALRQGDRARGLRRWYAGIVREPRRMLLTAVPELVLGLGGLWWAWQHGSGLLRVVVVVLAVALLGDAVGDAILLRRAARRRVGAWAPR